MIIKLGGFYYLIFVIFIYILSSPFLSVVGDDRVIYTRAVDDTGNAANTRDGERD